MEVVQTNKLKENNKKEKRVLVTGGAGFLGSHLCDQLIALGYEVICVDNYFTGSKSNVLHLLNNPNFELIRHDITFPLYVEVDEIYNLACPASPIHYQHEEKVGIHFIFKRRNIITITLTIFISLRQTSVFLFGNGEWGK